MTEPTRRVGRSSFLLLCVGLAACEETTLPVRPDSEPKYTGVAANTRTSEPEEGDNLQAGTQQEFDFTVYYQIGEDWDDEDLDMWFLVRSWNDDVFVRFEYVDLVPIDDESGTLRFQGSFTVPNCGSIDELDLIGRIYTRDTDFSFYVEQDGYVVDVINASSTPCPL